MTRMRFAPTLLAAASLASAAAADTIVVGAGNPGAVQAAIDAAAPGDTICLGTVPFSTAWFWEPNGIVIDKPLTLIGHGINTTYLRATSDSAHFSAQPVRIENIPAGEEVRLIGMTLISDVGVGDTAPSVPVLSVLNCDGSVLVANVQGEAIETTEAFPLPLPGGAVIVDDCARVSFDHCGFGGPEPSLAQTALTGMAGMYVEDSNVSINGTALFGGGGISSQVLGDPGHGGPALHAVSSTVEVGRSNLIGADGRDGYFVWPFGAIAGDGGAAILLQDSNVEVRGGLINQLRGGNGSYANDWGPIDIGSGGSAAVLDALSVLSTTPDVVMDAGIDGDGVVTMPAVLTGIGGAWAQLAEARATMRVDPVIALAGGSVTFEAYAEPFAIAGVGFSIAQGPALTLPGISGTFVVDLTSVGTLPALLLDANGAAQITAPLPSDPAFAGATFVTQTVAANPSGALSVSPPSALGIVN